LNYDLKEDTANLNLKNSTVTNSTTAGNNTINAIHSIKKQRDLYTDSAFAIIVIGCIDLFISSFLLYVALLRKYELRIVVFVAAIWGFVMAFLNLISFGITLSLGEAWVEMSIFLVAGIMECFFGYVIFSYFHFMTVVIERGLDEVNMQYYADDDGTVVTTAPSEIQMDEANDNRLVMDDVNEDYPEFGDDGRIPLT
jgi:hypothetical protein